MSNRDESSSGGEVVAGLAEVLPLADGGFTFEMGKRVPTRDVVTSSVIKTGIKSGTLWYK